MFTVVYVCCLSCCVFVVGGCKGGESDEPVVEGGVGGSVCGCMWVSDMGKGWGAAELLEGEIVRFVVGMGGCL